MFAIGLATAIGASLLFGSLFVPMKRVSTDGFFAQLMMCVGGMLAAILISALSNLPPIYPLAMLGGVVWCVANAVAIKLIVILGMALAVLIFNSTACLTGWAISRFGLFGIRASTHASNLLNAAGIVLLIVGGIIYLFIKSRSIEVKYDDVELTDNNETVKTAARERQRGAHFGTRIGAMAAALVCGIFYGAMATPITYMQQNSASFSNAPVEGLPYLLSLFCGITVTSIIIYLVNAIRIRNLNIQGTVVLPALCSGVIFASGMALFLTALEHLSATIAYPLCTMMPGLVATAWSVLYFKEITGARNFGLLAAAYGITLVGVILVALSNDASL